LTPLRLRPLQKGKTKKPASRKRLKHTGNLVSDDLRSLVTELEAVKGQAEAVGIVTGGWDLLECHVCGLMEDVGM
jgi:hypothetical protein